MMTQRDRDRLVVLKKVQKRLITQAMAAAELQVSERQVRRLLAKLAAQGDRAVVHGLRGRPSNRKLDKDKRQRIVAVLSEDRYRDYGPTLASEMLARRHGLKVGREALRQLMISAGLWRARKRKAEKVHTWRPRRSRFGELVQWDTSEHDWLEGRGDKLKLIRMMDDATSRAVLRFVRHDSTEENLKTLEVWLRRYGRMGACYTDKAGLFVTTEKTQRGWPRGDGEPQTLPPTQIGRALKELGITWIPAHSPQAKGRVERGFHTDQDRLVKGLREAGAATLEQANAYLEQEYEPWWEANCTVRPQSGDDAHKPLAKQHDLASILSIVHRRKVSKDYTVRFEGAVYRIDPRDVRTGLRGDWIRVEQRLDGTLAFQHQGRWLRLESCPQPAKAGAAPAEPRPAKPRKPAMNTRRTPWMRDWDLHASPPIWRAAALPERPRRDADD